LLTPEKLFWDGGGGPTPLLTIAYSGSQYHHQIETRILND